MEPVESTAATAAEAVAAAAETVAETAAETVQAASDAAQPVVDAVADAASNAAETAADAASAALDTAAGAVNAVTTTAAELLPDTDAPACDSNCNAGKVIGIVFVAVVVVVAILAAIFRRKKNSADGGSDEKAAPAAANGKVVEIYVGNLSYAMTDEQLRKEFERFGVVKLARVIGHRASGKSKGYGFVEMPHRKEAEIAIKNLNNRDVMGRKLRVNEARHGIPKE